MRFAHILVFLLLVTTEWAAASYDGSIFDVLNMTVFDGNWDVLGQDTQDSCVCEYPGTLYVITKVSKGKGKRGDPKYRIYVKEWRSCIFREYDDYGSAICKGDGCWISMIHRNFMMFDDVWRQRTDGERVILNNTTRFKGVCPRDWHPFYGDPATKITVQNHKHLWGDPKTWFENASIINGKMYIEKGSDMIIDPNVWHSVDEIKSYKNCKKCDRWIPHFDSLNVTTTTSEFGETIDVNVVAVLKWYYRLQDCHMTCDDIICYDRFRNTTETAGFTVSAPKPDIMSAIERYNLTAEITMYNNTFDPYSIIDVDVSETIVLTSFNYKNNTTNHFHRIGRADEFAIEYINHSAWKTTPNQTMVYHTRESCIIYEAPLDLSELQIRVSTPYTTENVTNCTITMVTSEPSDYIDLKNILFVVSSIVLFVFIVAANARWYTR